MNNYDAFHVKWHSAQHNGPEFRYLPFALHSKTFLSGKVHFLQRGFTFRARRSIHLHFRVRGIAPRCIGLMATLIDRRIFFAKLISSQKQKRKRLFWKRGKSAAMHGSSPFIYKWSSDPASEFLEGDPGITKKHWESRECLASKWFFTLVFSGCLQDALSGQKGNRNSS